MASSFHRPIATASLQSCCCADEFSRDGGRRWQVGKADLRVVVLTQVPTKQRLPFSQRLNQVIDFLFFAP